MNLFVYSMKTLLFLMLLFSCHSSSAQWSTQLQGGIGSFQSVHFADANSGFVTGSRFQFYKTANGGSTWLSQNNNAGPEELTSVFMTSPNDIYIVIKAVSAGNLDQLFISHDGGINFILNRYGIFRTVHFQNPTTGYLAGPSGTMVKTNDAGLTWSQLSTGTTQLVRDVYFPNGQIGFIVGDNGLLRKTSNAGASWQALYSGTSTSLAAVYFTSSTTGYCVGANGTALRTQDGGNTWAAMSVGVTVALHDIIFTSPSIGFIVGDFGTILRTSDGGTTWQSEQSNTFESLNALATVANGRVWAVGDNGTVLVRNSTITAARNSLAADTYQLYPNPVTEAFTIESGSIVDGPVHIQLTDIAGREVLVKDYKVINGAKLSVPTTNLAAGFYLVQVTNSKGTWTKRITKTTY